MFTSPAPDGIDLEQLTAALQPVLDLRNGQVYGFEALLRGPAGSDVQPLSLFRRARREHWHGALEARARSLGFEAAERHLRGTEVLFLNGDIRLPLPAHAYPHLVLEVSESQEVNRSQVEKLRAQGFNLFLDDYGVSQGNLGRILDVQPTGIKVDRSLIRGIAHDHRKFAMARAMSQLCRELGIKLVAEGIETREDLVAACRAGFEYGQGYYLGRPQLVPDRDEIATTSRLLRGLAAERRFMLRRHFLATTV